MNRRRRPTGSGIVLGEDVPFALPVSLCGTPGDPLTDSHAPQRGSFLGEERVLLCHSDLWKPSSLPGNGKRPISVPPPFGLGAGHDDRRAQVPPVGRGMKVPAGIRLPEWMRIAGPVMKQA